MRTVLSSKPTRVLAHGEENVARRRTTMSRVSCVIPMTSPVRDSETGHKVGSCSQKSSHSRDSSHGNAMLITDAKVSAQASVPQSIKSHSKQTQRVSRRTKAINDSNRRPTSSRETLQEEQARRQEALSQRAGLLDGRHGGKSCSDGPIRYSRRSRDGGRA